MMLERKWITHKVVTGLPTVAKFMVAHTPSTLLRISLERWFNLAFRQLITRGELNFIRKRRILIEVTDIALHFSVGLDKNHLKVDVQSQTGDVIVGAELGDFILLVGGQSDPDTLFFRRRLRITGDTELGLALKNFLDRVEVNSMLPPLLYRGLLELTEGLSEQRTTKFPV